MLYEFIKSRALAYKSLTVNGTEISAFFREVEILGKKLTKHKYGILCDDEFNSAKSFLACLYAKKTAVMLSKRYGAEHTKKIIETIEVSHLITDGDIIGITEEKQEKEELSDVALIMCTSGTTGAPKGAMLSEENILINLLDIEKYFKLKEYDTILICRPLYHCAVLTSEFLISLILGIHIVFVNETMNPVGIIEKIQKHNINVFCGTPTLFHHICRFAGRLNASLPLSTIAVSGECMTLTTAKEMIECFPSTDIYHVYGMTEASPRISYLKPELFNDNPISVGCFLEAVSGKIIDYELYISGKNIMKGYYNGKRAEEWFPTGDLAEIKDGLLYIKGRKDNMIIRAGMNIYPQEIESLLKTDKRISEVLAYGVKHPDVGQKIHIDVETELSLKDVVELCKKLLPLYQQPDCVNITRIMRNASGKIIRN